MYYTDTEQSHTTLHCKLSAHDDDENNTVQQ